MRAPMPPADTAELVAAIVSEYQPRKGDRAKLEAEVRAAVIMLQAINGNKPAFGYPADNKKLAEDLQKWASEGEALFAKMIKSRDDKSGELSPHGRFLRLMFYGFDLVKPRAGCIVSCRRSDGLHIAAVSFCWLIRTATETSISTSERGNGGKVFCRASSDFEPWPRSWLIVAVAEI